MKKKRKVTKADIDAAYKRGLEERMEQEGLAARKQHAKDFVAIAMNIPPLPHSMVISLVGPSGVQEYRVPCAAMRAAAEELKLRGF